MRHIAAFEFTASNTGVGVFVQVPGVADAYLAITSDGHFLIPPGAVGGGNGLRLDIATVMGVGTTVGRIDNARLRGVVLPEIDPINATAAIAGAFWFQEFGQPGPLIPPNDPFGIQADNTGANPQTGFAILTDGNDNVPVGERYTVRCLAVNGGSATQATTVANSWTGATLVPQQTLAVGKYAVIGMDAIGTTLLAARIIPPNGGMRPGAICRAAQSIFSTGQFRNGRRGMFTDFYSYAFPQVELFDSAAVTAAFTVWLDVVKVGGPNS